MFQLDCLVCLACLEVWIISFLVFTDMFLSFLFAHAMDIKELVVSLGCLELVWACWDLPLCEADLVVTFYFTDTLFWQDLIWTWVFL